MIPWALRENGSRTLGIRRSNRTGSTDVRRPPRFHYSNSPRTVIWAAALRQYMNEHHADPHWVLSVVITRSNVTPRRGEPVHPGQVNPVPQSGTTPTGSRSHDSLAGGTARRSPTGLLDSSPIPPRGSTKSESPGRGARSPTHYPESASEREALLDAEARHWASGTTGVSWHYEAPAKWVPSTLTSTGARVNALNAVEVE